MFPATPPRWSDIEVGDPIPRVELHVTFSKLVLGATSAWDYFPGHHDPDYARAQGQPTTYVNTSFYEGFIDRVITDWLGPTSFITRRKLYMRESVFAGDAMYGAGEVRNTRVDDLGRQLVDVDLEIGNADGPRCAADATIWFRT